MRDNQLCYLCDEEEALANDKVFSCDNCSNYFCQDHGQIGGDRQVQDVGPVAYPNLCNQCMSIN